jgi:general secretion pathway protein N
MNVRASRLVTQALAGCCGALLLLAIAQYAGLGRGYHWSDEAAGGGDPAAVGAIDKRPVQLPPASAFAAIEAHPLFNDDRQPTPQGPSDGSEDTPPPSPLNVALTGVILDEPNDVRIAMLQDKASNQSIALSVGMPLQGDQAAWTLVEVKPRAAVFRNAANETAEVELETAVVPAARPAPPRNARTVAPGRPGNANANARDAKGQEAGSDLARRIEERRARMREDAERQRAKKAAATPKK